MRNRFTAILMMLFLVTAGLQSASAEEVLYSGIPEAEEVLSDVTASSEEEDDTEGNETAEELLSAEERGPQEEEDLTLIALSEEYLQYSSEEHQGMTPDPNEGNYPELPQVGASSYVVETAVQWAIGIANDQSHGYSMANRWGPDYDCSSLIIAAFRQAGLELTGALYTGNMVSVFTKYGFTCYSAYALGANTGSSQLQRGDILLDPVNHTELYIGNGQFVGAHSNTPSASHPNRSYRTGDQGDEISVCNYYVFPWTYVLRYTAVDRGVEMTSGYGQTIPDGDYIITSAMDPLFFLDITGSETTASDGKNVRLWSVVDRTGYDRMGTQDVWTVTFGSDGFYRIAQKGTDKVLEVAEAGTSDGDNVQVSKKRDTSGQRWTIRPAASGDGYQITAKCSSFDLTAAGPADRTTNVCQVPGKDLPAQSWEFIPYQPEHALPDGKYILKSALSDTLQLDVASVNGQTADGTNVRVWNETAGKNQISSSNIFDVKHIGNGYYRLTHAASGKVLDVAAQRTINHTSVRVWRSLKGNFGQLWAVTPYNGGYVLRARCSGQALDVTDGKTANGSNVAQSFFTGGASQIWTFVPADTIAAGSGTAMQKTEITHVFNSAKGADIRWNKLHGVSGYVIYRQRAAEGIVKIAVIEDPDAEQCYDPSIRTDCWGRVYHYFVRALYGTAEGPVSEKLPLQRLAPMKLNSLNTTASGTLAAAWTCSVKDNKAQGYEIQYAQSQEDLFERKGTFASRIVEGRSSLTAVLENLEKNKTYHVRIRSYVDYTHSTTGKQSRTWSQYSNVLTRTVR